VAYLSKKIEQAHILWFEKSNQWVQFDELQWLIFSLYVNGTNSLDAQEKLVEDYSLSHDEASKLVDSIFDSIKQLFNPEFSLPDFTLDHEIIAETIFSNRKNRNYSYRGKYFTINYYSPFLEKYIHLPLAHLESDISADNTFSLDVFPFKNKFALRIGGDRGRSLWTDEPGQIKRLLYIELANFFFNKQEDEWLTFIHGSAIKRGNNVLVLTAEGGSGKSTLAGLLQLNGFYFFSDDFIPIDTRKLNAFPFPASLCVKGDSVSLLESLGLNLHYISPKGSAYASVESLQTDDCKIKGFVFVKYNKQVDLLFEPLSTLDALNYFLKEAWVGNDMKRAKTFIDWFAKQKFYRLEYGNNQKAIEILTNLMKK
jgi:hypothetical protein